MTMRGRFFGLGVLMIVCAAGRAEAEEAAPKADTSPGAASSGAPAAKDIVRLKNGGILRGTIGEMIPGQSVTIVTVTGKTHEFPMSEVAYAGPAEGDSGAALAPDKSQPAPAAPPAGTTVPAPSPPAEESAEPQPQRSPYVTINGPESHLHLESTPPGITFHREDSSAIAQGVRVATAKGYDRLCTAPCDITLPAGTETFALSEKDEAPIPADAVTLPAGSARLQGEIQSRAGSRVAGWIVIVVGSAAGTVLMVTARDEGGLNTSQFALGGGVLLGTCVAGGLLIATPDKAIVRVAGAAPKKVSLVAPGISWRGAF